MNFGSPIAIGFYAAIGGLSAYALWCDPVRPWLDEHGWRRSEHRAARRLSELLPSQTVEEMATALRDLREFYEQADREEIERRATEGVLAVVYEKEAREWALIADLELQYRLPSVPGRLT